MKSPQSPPPLPWEARWQPLPPVQFQRKGQLLPWLVGGAGAVLILAIALVLLLCDDPHPGHHPIGIRAVSTATAPPHLTTNE